MKPNPCKWCGEKAFYLEGVFLCPNYKCLHNYGLENQDLATWQKNNPIGWGSYPGGRNWEKLADATIGGEMKFKVGDRVKLPFGEETVEITEVLMNDMYMVKGYAAACCGEHLRLTRLPRKSIRRSLKSLKAGLLQLACEAGCRDRAWGEQIDKMADDVRELIEKV
jgi:hypothetical protein